MNTKFLTYLNTRQFFTNRWKGDVFDNSIFVNDTELQRWNVSRNELETMPQIKTVGLNKYNVLNVSDIDISLIKPHGRQLTNLHRYMLQCVVGAELPTTVTGTPYWYTFVKHRSKYADLFFTVDEFAGRVHTPVSGMSKELRPFLLLQGEQTVSIDVAQMQPTLLANILYQNIGNNAFSDTINAGTDIYTMLRERAKLSTRNEAKKLFFEMLFSKPNNKLEQVFEGANFIQWINWYKSTPDTRNPHTNEKTYSNLAFLLQTYEVRIMGEIWRNLAQNNIPFLSVHDEIICRKSDSIQVETIFNNVLSKHFSAYKLNISQAPEPIQKISLFDIGMQVLGEVNNMTKNRLLAEMIKRYSITDSRAECGFNSLLNAGIIEATNVDTYYMTHSTPF